MAPDGLQQIRQIENLAKDAWPAAQREHLDGWEFRFTYGITRRANSVWPNGVDGMVPLAEKLNEAELFYAVYEMPARFQISPVAYPQDLDIVLAMRGYQRSAETAVQSAPIDVVIAATGRRLHAGFRVDVANGFSEEWMHAYVAIEQIASRAATVRQDILKRIRARRAFALARINDEPAAVGLGVLDGEWLGIFCMATQPTLRRRGAANAVLNALAVWAQAHGARRTYLQVMSVNEAGLAFYATAGFEPLYQYHYREKTV